MPQPVPGLLSQSVSGSAGYTGWSREIILRHGRRDGDDGLAAIPGRNEAVRTRDATRLDLNSVPFGAIWRAASADLTPGGARYSAALSACRLQTEGTCHFGAPAPPATLPWLGPVPVTSVRGSSPQGWSRARRSEISPAWPVCRRRGEGRTKLKMKKTRKVVSFYECTATVPAGPSGWVVGGVGCGRSRRPRGPPRPVPRCLYVRRRCASQSESQSEYLRGLAGAPAAPRIKTGAFSCRMGRAGRCCAPRSPALEGMGREGPRPTRPRGATRTRQ